MSSSTRSNKRFTPSAKARNAAAAPRLVDESTPGFLWRGAYVMVLACTPEVCGCTSATPVRGGQQGFLGDVAQLMPYGWRDGVRPLYDIYSGGLYLTAGPSDADDVVLTWEWDEMIDLMTELYVVPLSGRTVALGHPGMPEYVLVPHGMDVAFARAILQLGAHHTMLTS